MKSLILITGTSKGLGHALKNILSMRDQYYIVTINRNDINESHPNIMNVKLDLAEFDQVEQSKLIPIITRIIKNEAPQQIIFINNAYSIFPLNKIIDLNEEDILKSYYTNVLSPILLIKSFIKITQKIKTAKKIIINISSGAANRAIDGWSMYCSTKASMQMFIKSIDLEYKDFTAINVDPGVIDTSMQANIRDYYNDVDNYFCQLSKNNLLSTPEEAANRIILEHIQ